ncbi:phospholipase D family protein [Seongchinamella sediminis]|uniref:Phospholipase D family protein n=1 Tax=Seongchinamella sediminis TaxID=2283635 RepID=A0A3L7DW70_9GAMM|nr:phospholipase D family protein [Seongchinamella sediminis]RLQ21817.1 phospholipase D family protein [Seongchinamella sediminis]
MSTQMLAAGRRQRRSINCLLERAAIVLAAMALALLTACSGPGLREQRPVDRALSQALPPAQSGTLAGIAAGITSRHGNDQSGFRLLDSSEDGLRWRLALIDSATTSLDIQTYLWYPDYSGALILERVIKAAERGVRVRIIVDDLILQGQDQLIANLHAAPNIEFGIFNPWTDRRSLVNRAGEMLARMERLNIRMHDKLMIADGHAVVIGGRNIGDHYFGLSDTYNFHDTDLLGIGHIGIEASEMFDHFWNSEWVATADALTTEPDQALAREQRQKVQARLQGASRLQRFPLAPGDWSAEFGQLAPELRIGRSKLVYDEAAREQISQKMAGSMFNFFNIAEEELLIQNAYIIPGDEAIDFLERKRDAGVKIRVLTNSLASHDVPAVNSHYEPWRDDFIQAGVDLWEFRSDPAIKSTVVDVPPVNAGFSGLHSKCAVADRRYVFVGSMNLDPRSRAINTEMGAMIDSPALAEDLARMLERNMSGENAWHVQMDDRGKLSWVNSEQTLDKQPARDGMQRVMNVLMKLGPRDQY